MLLTEGWDEPSADCVVCLRPTKIRSLYAQIVGRGTRLCPGKDNLLLLDFLWHTDRHELCHPAHLICDNSELADAVTKILADEANARGLDLEDACERGSAAVVAKREEGLAKQLSEMRKRRRELVDPIQFEYSIQAEDLVTYAPAMQNEMAPVTGAQRSALEKAGIFPDEVGSSGRAAKILDRLAKRKSENLSTPKQIRLLEKYGFSHVGQWSFDEANKLITRVAANGWMVPRQIDIKSYRPKQQIGGQAA
jgi:hypothetical protein